MVGCKEAQSLSFKQLQAELLADSRESVTVAQTQTVEDDEPATCLAALRPLAFGYAAAKGYDHPLDIKEGMSLFMHLAIEVKTNVGLTQTALQLIACMPKWQLNFQVEEGRLRGWRPLHVLVRNKPSNAQVALLVDRLVLASADVNARGRSGEPPLMVAAATGNMEGVIALLSLDADTMLVNERSQNVFDVSVMSNHEITRACRALGIKYGPGQSDNSRGWASRTAPLLRSQRGVGGAATAMRNTRAITKYFVRNHYTARTSLGVAGLSSGGATIAFVLTFIYYAGFRCFGPVLFDSDEISRGPNGVDDLCVSVTCRI